MKKLLFAVVLMVILLCVCGVVGAYGLSQLLGTDSSPELARDCPEIPVSQEAAINFLTKIATALQDAPQTGQISLVIRQEEVTSLVAIGAQVSEQMQSLQSPQNLENLNPEQLQQLRELEGTSQLEALKGLLQKQPAGTNGASTFSLPDLSLRLTLEEPQICMKQSEGLIIRGYVSLRDWQQPVRIVTAPRAARGELVLDFVEGRLGPIPMPEVVFDMLGQGVAEAVMAGQQYAEITQIAVGNGALTITGRVNN